MSTRAPLVPPEIDLRSFGSMPLDVARLRDSDLASASDAEVFRVNVLSWCVAWHQMPAGSLPDDDKSLARLLGFGRDMKGWKRLREGGGLRGWVKCSDGRLYHPVVAQKVKEAWGYKETAKRKREQDAERLRRWRMKHGGNGDETHSETRTETHDETVSSRREQNRSDRIGSDRSKGEGGAPTDPGDLFGGAAKPAKPSERKVVSSVFDRLANACARIPREDEGKWQAMVDSFGEDRVTAAVRMVHSRGERAYFSAVREEVDRIPSADQPSIRKKPATSQPSLEDRAIAIANEIGWRAAADLIGDPIITTADRLEDFLRDESNGYAQRLIDRAAKRGQDVA